MSAPTGTAEIRVDPMTGDHIAVASHRRGRIPQRAPEPPRPERHCPFCPGHESETEAALAAVPSEGAWQIRVVRNKWPLFAPIEAHGDGGDHEVVVEHPDHEADLPDYEPSHAGALVRIWRDRLAVLGARPDVRHVSLFRNRGRRSGGSEHHPHSQIIAVPIVPPGIEHRAAIARAHRDRTGRSLLADRAGAELADGRRIVARAGEWIVLTPYAPHRSFETWIVPAEPDRQGPFPAIDDAAATSFAATLVSAARAVRAATGGADYNLVLRQLPGSWYLEILPRLGGQAGFELESGIQIVVVAPEIAAAELRAAHALGGSG